MKKLLTALFAAGIVFSVAAQDAPKPGDGKCPPPRGPKCERRVPGPRAPHARKPFATPQQWENLGRLKEKYAKEIAEIEAKRKAAMEQMAAANDEFFALAEKEGLDIPGLKQWQHKQKMKAFFKKYEKELKEIRELRKTDPRAAHAKYMELLKKEGIDFRPFCGPKGPKCHGPRKGPGGPKAPAPRRAPAK